MQLKKCIYINYIFDTIFTFKKMMFAVRINEIYCIKIKLHLTKRPYF